MTKAKLSGIIRRDGLFALPYQKGTKRHQCVLFRVSEDGQILWKDPVQKIELWVGRAEQAGSLLICRFHDVLMEG